MKCGRVALAIFRRTRYSTARRRRGDQQIWHLVDPTQRLPDIKDELLIKNLISDATRSKRQPPHATFAWAFAGRSPPKKLTVVRSYRQRE